MRYDKTMSEPYFYIQNRNGGLVTRGVTAHSAGYKIPAHSTANPDGIFCEWSWDGKRLTAANDRWGFRPLFYCFHQDTLYLSPSIRELLAQGVPRELDPDALSVFLRLGFFVGEDTPFKHIKILPPDATFAYEEGKLTVSGHYSVRSPIQISENDAIDEYIRLFRQAMQRRLPASGEKFLVPLSGGRDSRHILMELCHLGYKPEYAVTMRPYPPYYDEDIRIAREISQALGVNHLTLEHKSSYFADELQSFEMTNYGSDEHAWFVELGTWFKGRTNVSYDGIAGDVFTTGDFWKEELFDLIRTGRYSEACERLLGEWEWMRPNDDVLKEILPSDFFKTTNRDRAIARIIEELKRHQSAHNPLTAFYFWNRTRRKIALMSYGVNTGVPTIHSPYLDHDLYNFLAALPPSLLATHTLHTKAIERAYPQYTNIPYEDNDAQKIDASGHQQQFTKELAWHSLKTNLWSSRLLRGRYLLPRMAKCLVSKKYSASLWRVKPPIIAYLHQLERLQRVGGAYGV